MAIIECYECEKEISDKEPACPHCGVPKEEQPPQSDPGGRKSASLRSASHELMSALNATALFRNRLKVPLLLSPVLPFIVSALIGFLLLLFLGASVLLTTLFVCVLGWCLKLVIRRNWFRGHHTQVVITTVLAWLFMWFANVQAQLDRPDLTATSASSVVIGGLLALGIRIFGNPPPLEDEEENG